MLIGECRKGKTVAVRTKGARGNVRVLSLVQKASPARWLTSAPPELLIAIGKVAGPRESPHSEQTSAHEVASAG